MDNDTQRIVDSIKSSSAFIGIYDVVDPQTVVAVAYSEDVKNKVVDLLRTGAYDQLATLPPPEYLFDDELRVVRFSDGKEKVMYALLHDVISFGNDLPVLGIYPQV